MDFHIDKPLPPRLYATKHFPSHRINVYSRPELLTFVSHYLRGTPELRTILSSPLGKLFQLPVNQSPFPVVLFTICFSRQLVTRKMFEVWMTFAGKPFCFSLTEFASVTGLNCAEFPHGYNPNHNPPSDYGPHSYWAKLIVGDSRTTLQQIRDRMEANPGMDGDLKLRLALILIVDGVLIAKPQIRRPTLKYVKLVEDVDAFLSFPWGRESFLTTIAGMRPDKSDTALPEGDLPDFRVVLEQETFRLQGFSLALQLVAFQAIPSLLAVLPPDYEKVTVPDLTEPRLPGIKIVNHPQFLGAETSAIKNPVQVTPTTSIPPEKINGWGYFYNENDDTKVNNLLQLIRTGYEFSTIDWVGGDTSLPEVVYPEKRPQNVDGESSDSWIHNQLNAMQLQINDLKSFCSRLKDKLRQRNINRRNHLSSKKSLCFRTPKSKHFRRTKLTTTDSSSSIRLPSCNTNNEQYVSPEPSLPQSPDPESNSPKTNNVVRDSPNHSQIFPRCPSPVLNDTNPFISTPVIQEPLQEHQFVPDQQGTILEESHTSSKSPENNVACQTNLCSPIEIHKEPLQQGLASLNKSVVQTRTVPVN